MRKTINSCLLFNDIYYGIISTFTYNNILHYGSVYVDYVININPDHADAYFNRAILFENLLQYSNAIKDYTQAIALQPNYLMAYHYRGMVRFKMEDMYGALSDFTKALSLALPTLQ